MVEQVVGLKFVPTGQEQVKKAYSDLAKAEDQLQQKMTVGVNVSQKNSKSLDQIVRASTRAENEIRRLAQAKQQGQVTAGQFQGELNKIAARLRGMGMEKAQSEVLKLGRSYSTATTEAAKQRAEIQKLQAALGQVANSKVRVAAAAKTATDATSRTRQAFLNTANSIAILDGPLGGVASRFSAFGVLIGRTGILLGTFAVGISALSVFTVKAVKAFMEFEVQTAKIEAILKTTGAQAGLTGSEIEGMAARIALSTLESESAVRDAATQLLTFKNVGKDVFETTLRAASDMAALGFGTIQSETVKLAKALDDPRQSLTSLSRSGITFTRQQRQLIISLVESGRQAEAMDRILQNVNRQVGGAGEAAARDTMAGAFDTIGQAVSRATRDLGQFVVESLGVGRTVGAIAESLAGYAGGPASLQDQIKSLREQIANAEPEAEGFLGRMAQSYAATTVGSNKLRESLEAQLAILERRLEMENRANAAIQARTQAQQRSNSVDNLRAESDAIRENIGLTEQQIRVNRALAAEGLLNVDLSAEMERYVSALQRAGTPQSEILRLAQAHYRTLMDAKDAADELALSLQMAEAGRAMARNIESLDDQNAILAEQIRLIDEGVSYSESRRQAELNLQLVLAQNLLLEGQITQEKYDQLAAAVALNQVLSAEVETRKPVTVRKARGGGSSRKQTSMEEIVAGMEAEISQQRILIGLYDQERRTQEILFDLTKRNETADIKMTESALRNAAERMAADEQTNNLLQEQRDIRENLAQTIESSMESAFMSMVDGTKSAKDAFKDMARTIIAELYKVLVVQRAVGQFKTGGGGILGSLAPLFGFANGGAFQGGNVIPFANGGVVNSPTTFPMRGGQTGLMGEAGPEAIMPLKRTASGKLGVVAEGGGVVVNNNINVQGDNAAAVRAEVAKLMPTITQATKSAVIDARRRGGQMRAAFS
jgi:phage-related minor tail protein